MAAIGVCTVQALNARHYALERASHLHQGLDRTFTAAAADCSPGAQQWRKQTGDFIQRGNIVLGVRMEQAHLAIGIQIVQILSNLAASRHIQMGAKAFTDDVQRLVDVFDLLIYVALGNGLLGQFDAILNAFDQQNH
jgi:hypothetical protein